MGIEQYIPSVQAYSGVGNPIKSYNVNQSYSWTNNGDTSATLSFTVTDNGIMQGFLASVNITNFTEDAANPAGRLTVTLKKNGNTLHQGTLDVYEYKVATGSRFLGIAYQEGLNWLAGTELIKGDKFDMVLELTNNINLNLYFTATMFMVMQVKASQFVI